MITTQRIHVNNMISRMMEFRGGFIIGCSMLELAVLGWCTAIWRPWQGAGIYLAQSDDQQRNDNVH